MEAVTVVVVVVLRHVTVTLGPTLVDTGRFAPFSLNIYRGSSRRRRRRRRRGRRRR